MKINKNTHPFWKVKTKSNSYRIWIGVKSRCLNKKSTNYFRYGARGITVCKRWLKFENFLLDMGERPDGMTLERINNNIGYSPSNCRWATRLEQSLNTRRNIYIEYKGVKKTIKEWSKELKVSEICIRNRHKKGWPIEKILNTPSRKSKKYFFLGKYRTLQECSEYTGLSKSAIWGRLNRGTIKI